MKNKYTINSNLFLAAIFIMLFVISSCKKDDDNQNDNNNNNPSSALPGGSWTAVGGFNDMGDYCYFWTSTSYNTNNAYFYFMRKEYENIYLNSNIKMLAQSVRCVKD